MRKYVALVPFVLLMAPAVASAHVTVKPSQVGAASFQTFDMSVPVEKDIATTALRLVIPAGLKHVTPTVKPGWTIVTKESADGVVSEISWTAGSIPAGRRDDFTFSAQAPADTGDIQWKAYQTYADGSVVSWDQATQSDDDEADLGPYSVTKVVDDTAATAAPVASSAGTSDTTTSREKATFVMSAAALALAALATAASLGRRR